MADYVHGTDPLEQERLVAQAEFWRDDLILPGLPYRAGESLLEVGCGVGAVLRVVGEAHPGLRLHGLDREPDQVAFAERHLRGLGVELRTGDALALPWPDASFDHVLMMWFLEHLADPVRALAEARRVLRPGGTLRAIECDYTRFALRPSRAEVSDLLARFVARFGRSGWVDASTRMGDWARAAGFREVECPPAGFTWSGPGLPGKTDYLLGFIEPLIPELGGDEAALRSGAASWRRAAREPGTSFTVEIRRLLARR